MQTAVICLIDWAQRPVLRCLIGAREYKNRPVTIFLSLVRKLKKHLLLIRGSPFGARFLLTRSSVMPS